MPSLLEAERACEQLARREAKNFYWGFISLPYRQRVAIYALYAFARQVDDEADKAEADKAENRRPLPERLRAYRERVRRAVRGEYDDPVMQVLSDAIARYAIPERELQELIDGVELDFSRNRYETWEDLRGYCLLVASVVGRMCVRIFGFDDPIALDQADELGLALQLTNILRDVREDAGLGRVYLPLEELHGSGIREADLLACRPGPGWGALVALEVERARALFERGYGVLEHIPRRPAVCVRTMAGIYQRILEKIAAEPALPLRERASLSAAEKLLVMAKSWIAAA